MAVGGQCIGSRRCWAGCNPRWPSVLEGMRALERLLRSPLMRERLQACCLADAAPEEIRLFDSWSLSLKSLRWQAITEFSDGLLKLELPLRRWWSMAKFLHGTGHASKFKPRPAESEYGITVESINKVIQDACFWSGLAVVHDISHQAEHVGKWGEGCGCCEPPSSKASASVKARFKACPYKGCRSPDLATGAWQADLDKVMSASRSRITGILMQSGHAGQTIRASLLSDWTNARARLWSQIRVKLGHWSQLPWKL